MNTSDYFRQRRLYMLIHRLHIMQLVQIPCLLVYRIMLKQRADNRISQELRDRRDVVRQELLNEILISDRTPDIIRMSPQAFVDLCKKLMIKGDLKPSRHASVEEQVAKFLYIVGHNVLEEKNIFFRRSGESNCRHFHNVLRSMIMLEETYF
jgi:hypothetical protein